MRKMPRRNNCLFARILIRTMPYCLAFIFFLPAMGLFAAEEQKAPAQEKKTAPSVNPFADIDAVIQRISKDLEKATETKKISKLNEQLKKEQDKKLQRLSKLEKDNETQLDKLYKALEESAAMKQPEEKITADIARLKKQMKDINSWYKGIPPSEEKQAPADDEKGKDPKNILKQVL